MDFFAGDNVTDGTGTGLGIAGERGMSPLFAVAGDVPGNAAGTDARAAGGGLLVGPATIVLTCAHEHNPSAAASNNTFIHSYNIVSP
jgi:hypothetical protein